MSLAPQLLVFQSRMFLTSQYIHKRHFQISFLQRKVSQPEKLKNLVHLSGPIPTLLTSTAYAAWRTEYVRFASEQILTSWGKAFCGHKLPHPTLLGPMQLPPSHLLQLYNSIFLLKLNNQSLNDMRCKFPLFLFKTVASKLLRGKSRNVIFLLTFHSKKGIWAVSPFYTLLFNRQFQLFSTELHFKCRSTEGKTT